MLTTEVFPPVVCFEHNLLYLLDNGSCGLSEEEMDASVATLESMASTLEADCVLLRKHKVEQGDVSEYLVRKRAKDNDFVEVRYAALTTESIYVKKVILCVIFLYL